MNHYVYMGECLHFNIHNYNCSDHADMQSSINFVYICSKGVVTIIQHS